MMIVFGYVDFVERIWTRNFTRDFEFTHNFKLIKLDTLIY